MFAGMQRGLALLATFLVVSTSLVALAPATEAASVTPEATKLDKALVGASSVQLNGKTYIFGGRYNDGSYSDRIISVNLASGTIDEIARLPTSTVAGAQATPGRYSGTAVAFGDKIYYFGGAQLTEQDINGDGRNEFIPRASRDIIEFDPATNQARVLIDQLDVGAWGMSSIVANGMVYLFGGFSFDISDLPNTGRHDWVIRFDPSATDGSKQKQLLTKLPYGVQDSAAALIGRRVFIMGGLSDHNNDTNPCPTYVHTNPQTGAQEDKQITVCLTKRIIAFDPTPNQEVAIGVAGEIPYRAQFITATVVGGKAYIAGALLADGTPSSSIIEVALDRVGSPQSRVITPTLPKASFGQAVSTDGQTILVAGGRTGGDRDLSDQIVRIDPRATLPWAPRSATALEITGGVRLSWEAPAYNGDATITGYRIYRSGANGLDERIAETTSLAYEDKTVRPGTEYTWRIVAVNAVGESDASARISRSSGVAVPGVPESFQAFGANNEVLLRWRAPNETGGSNITGYRVLRNDALLTSLPPDATEFVDRAVTNGETYLYQVRAINSKGEGALTTSERVTPAAVPPAPTSLVVEAAEEPTPAGTSASVVRLSWSPPAEPVSRYLVYRAAKPGGAGSLIANLTATSYTDSAVERGQTYYYTIASENDVGRSPPSIESPVSLVSKPGSPREVVTLGQEGEIRVAWQPPTETGDAPETSLRYTVSRGSGGQTPRPIATDLLNTLYVDRLVTPGVEYTYTVTTLNPLPSDASPGSTATARALQNKPPTAVLAILPPVANAGEPVEIDASNSIDIDGTIRSYLFDFGDGADPVSTGTSTVSHQYVLNGTYVATVVVTDNRGTTSSATAQIVIGETVKEAVENGLSKGPPPARTTNTTGDQRPGSTEPALPGPGAALLVLAIAGLSLVIRRRR